VIYCGAVAGGAVALLEDVIKEKGGKLALEGIKSRNLP
jgi:hypothetical protein